MSRGRHDRFDRLETGALVAAVPDGLPWLAEAARLHDERGSVGLATGRRLVRLVDRVDRALPVDLPWCGLFVAHCIRTGVPEARLPIVQIRARPWLGFGERAEPQIGAILVFWLRSPTSPFGHVGFYWGEDAEHFHVLGGNQRETIEVERIPKARLLGGRWPPGHARPGLRRPRDPEAASPFEHGSDGL